MTATLAALSLTTLLAGPSLAADTEQQWLEMIASGEAYSADTLVPLFKQLEPVDTDFMVGTWKGGKFDGGAEPDPINWYGKRFTSTTDVEPLLVNDAEGEVITHDRLGAAQMRQVVFDGKVSAALIYDSQPIMDYLRKVNEDVVIGLGDIKGKPTDFFFYLVRD
ncbi:GXWXG protein [Halopseudomonas litoralis]|uniref:GXWXG protein n=1 Tax=Halopseudomonas litoralis TaxID=797277 RepID=A0A1H1VT38_9GAMM|nr:DUF4334 domain-containing protein [Halopseudomonas litoralis]SDS87815.1 GXWXG protein [Halopseudomonas litoralis]